MSSASLSLHLPPFFSLLAPAIEREKCNALKGAFCSCKICKSCLSLSAFFFDAKAFFFSFFARLSLRDGYHILVFLLPTFDPGENRVNQRAKRVEQRDIVGFDEILSSQEL